MLEWLPEFALSREECSGITSYNALALLRKAAQAVYTSEKYSKRGEFGELLLHICIRQVFKTLPAISKLFYKDSTNHAVKGFDAVHVVVSGSALELWLGEVKFYSDIGRAIRDVAEELQQHTKTDYLRNEFMLISNKVDKEWSHARKLKRLLDPNTSLDEVFDCACIPVLLTYDSETVAGHTKTTDEYIQAFKEEVEHQFEKFASSKLPKCIRIHLFLVPLHEKKALAKALHERLKAWQKPTK